MDIVCMLAGWKEKDLYMLGTLFKVYVLEIIASDLMLFRILVLYMLYPIALYIRCICILYKYIPNIKKLYVSYSESYILSNQNFV